ncbi:flavodoxin [Clostridiaceae bacterium NSJ-31]|uniref:Flavodoxin n=1 Tax=Ligaoa zhengdingensis TaxID=2763658 RepID=A0A926E0G2_9FIRM|nr:flavodoxin domain-containing protein [Ligaoa zhengdingensis]MBC8546794.1 flavodoxin [Ligaoa zhengdingensis]
MKKIAVVYQSNYGSTERYARWLAEELGADCYNAAKVRPDVVQDVPIIAYGGGLYAGGINGVSFLTRRPDRFQGKTLVVFTVGLNPVRDAAASTAILEQNFPPAMRDQVRLFHLNGALDCGKLNLLHRMMMKGLHGVLAKKKVEELTENDRMILNAYEKPVDFTDRKALRPVVDALKELERAAEAR